MPSSRLSTREPPELLERTRSGDLRFSSSASCASVSGARSPSRESSHSGGRGSSPGPAVLQARRYRSQRWSRSASRGERALPFPAARRRRVRPRRLTGGGRLRRGHSGRRQREEEGDRQRAPAARKTGCSALVIAAGVGVERRRGVVDHAPVRRGRNVRAGPGGVSLKSSSQLVGEDRAENATPIERGSGGRASRGTPSRGTCSRRSSGLRARAPA